MLQCAEGEGGIPMDPYLPTSDRFGNLLKGVLQPVEHFL
jgi:hypothetical protein